MTLEIQILSFYFFFFLISDHFIQKPCYGVPVIYITTLTTENIKLSKVLGLEQNYRRIYT